ncbi:uncharacterized protein LOC125491263 [Plutella xylostella]|uniref:uncharacterized protein LOC125491263 n=1 Tax=Plutella xylostella TaxID=51655 RepID=UPI002032D9BC|nr:uncharacterized protein LOC125491263 [Plutella xylostella]
MENQYLQSQMEELAGSHRKQESPGQPSGAPVPLGGPLIVTNAMTSTHAPPTSDNSVSFESGEEPTTVQPTQLPPDKHKKIHKKVIEKEKPRKPLVPSTTERGTSPRPTTRDFGRHSTEPLRQSRPDKQRFNRRRLDSRIYNIQRRGYPIHSKPPKNGVDTLPKRKALRSGVENLLRRTLLRSSSGAPRPRPTPRVFLGRSPRLRFPLSENNAFCFLEPKSPLCTGVMK